MLKLAFVLMLAAGVTAQERAPIGKGVNFYSKEKEAALGAELAKEVRRTNQVLASERARLYVERIGRDLAAQLPELSPAFTFEILAGAGDSMREPYALPGGHVFVPAGLFFGAENEAELAGLLAHAMAHAAARHATRLATRGQLIEQAGIPLINMGGWGGKQAALPLAFLSIQRRFELEADGIALPMMARAGYDPSALLRYVDRVQVDEKIRLHSAVPARDERIDKIKRAIADLPARVYTGDNIEFEHVRAEVRALEAQAVKPPEPPSLRR
ncbi:MAG: M48 family metalloprotease [Bryobacteraceae bacterium]